MLYHHPFVYGSAVLASARAEAVSIRPAARRPRFRSPSVWGLGAAAGLLSLPLRARASESDSGPDPDPELAGELCPVPPGDGSLDLAPESCGDPLAEAASHEPALLTVLGGDVRLEGLVLPQAPEGTAAGGGVFLASPGRFWR